MNFGKGDLLDQLFRAQGGRCFHCGEVMPQPRPRRNTKLAWTKEHIWPKSHPRAKALHGNIVLAHFRCNTSRGNPEPTAEELSRVHIVYAVMGLTPFTIMPFVKVAKRPKDPWVASFDPPQRGRRGQK